MNILFTHEKGGTGVTTSVVNIGYELALLGYSVLLVDLDSRGDVATSLGLDPLPGVSGYLSDFLEWSGEFQKEDMERSVRQVPGQLDVMSTNVTGFREALALARSDSLRVYEAFSMLGDHYDFVLFDSKAAGAELRSCALQACDCVVVCVRLEALGMADIGALFDLVGEGRHRFVLPVAMRGLNVHKYNLGLLNETFPDAVFDAVPDRVTVIEASSAQQPLATYAPRGDARYCYSVVAGLLAVVDLSVDEAVLA